MKSGKYILAAFGCLLAGNLVAQDYYVDNVRGSDDFDGCTPATAFKSVKKGASKLKPGDTLHLTKGQVYHEELHFPCSGTAAKPISVDGHGAVLCGLKPIPDDSWQAQGGDLFLSKNKICRGANRPLVARAVGSSCAAAAQDCKGCSAYEMVSVPCATLKNPQQYDIKSLKPGEAFWDSEGIWYHAAAGESPVGKGLWGGYLDCGVAYYDRNYIDVRNVITEWFSNDGFNMHGSCLGLTFRDIESRWCGDDGFSAHEDVQANIVNGWFHHCDDGIHDICAAQMMYSGCVVESNRLFGVGTTGGIRTFFDCTIRDNGNESCAQVFVEGGSLNHGKYHFATNAPMVRGRVYFKNTRIEGSKNVALCVRGPADATVDHGTFARNKITFFTHKSGTLHALDCVVADEAKPTIITEKGSTFVESSTR